MNSKAKDWKSLIKAIRDANKDPEFVAGVKDFINISSHRRIYKL